MKSVRRHAAAGLLGLAAIFVASPPVTAADADAVKRGEYVFNAGGCVGCHTNVKGGGKRLAGGRALDTPFGVFVTPNITPDKETGIGSWSEADLHRALRDGRAPDGSYYFPVFPFTSFTGMTDGDIADLYAYLMAQEPVRAPNRPHDIKFPFGFRPLMAFWRMLFFKEGPLQPDPQRDAAWNRGNYLANALAHCGECHTPRNVLGAMDESRRFAGFKAPDGQNSPNITPDKETGIGGWSVEDIMTLLKDGQTPDFDWVGSGMKEVVDNIGKLTDDDRRAIALYVKSVPPQKGTRREKKD
jgi:mono/diheme cytochrome c family protein